MNRNYECMLLLDNREVKRGWEPMKVRVATMLQKHGATIESSRLWAERKLAYPIQHQTRGTYLLVYFTSPTNAVHPISRELGLADAVLRHMIIACEAIPDSAHEPEPEFDVSQLREEDAPAPAPTAAASGEASEPAADAEKAEAGEAPAKPAEQTADAGETAGKES